MRLTPRLAVMMLLLAACSRDSDAPAPSRSGSSAPPDAETPADSDAVDAQSVIRAYYDAIAARDFTRAYLLWADSGRASGQTLAQFRAGFDSTASVSVRVGEPGRIEGAAGSRYITVPAHIEAVTTSGAPQRFAGTYTLRRAVVDGATAEQRQWRIHSADITRCADDCPDIGSDSSQVARTIHGLGARLRMVSLLAPHADVTGALRRHYSPYLTPELLARWSADPTRAPGRQVSSPWPRGIDLDTLTPEDDDAFTARGHIVHVTSADTTAAISREPVVIRLTRAASGWLINEFETATAAPTR